ncbi:amino acid ABC transporter substrate-binding protein [Mesorhizobium sp. ORM8.1]
MNAAGSLNSRLAAVCLTATLALLGASGVASAEELYGTLKKINDSNTIAVGHRESSIPFSYYDERKLPVGYAIDLCNKIVEEIKRTLNKPDLEVKYIMVSAKTRISMVVDKSVDMECGSTTNTLTRELQVDFSATYFATGTRVLTRKAAEAKEIEDFQGKAVGVVGGSTNERAVKELIDAGKLKNVRVIVVKDYAEGMASLETSGIDAFVSDDIVLYGLLSKSNIKSDLEVVGRSLTYDPYGVMFRRDDSAFRLVVNKALADVFRSGEIEAIYAKWFDPIGVPMSPLMKAGFQLQALPE